MMLVLVKVESLLQKASSETFLCVSFFNEKNEGKYCIILIVNDEL